MNAPDHGQASPISSSSSTRPGVGTRDTVIKKQDDQ
jgi:hypothetical protein